MLQLFLSGACHTLLQYRSLGDDPGNMLVDPPLLPPKVEQALREGLLLVKLPRSSHQGVAQCIYLLCRSADQCCSPVHWSLQANRQRSGRRAEAGLQNCILIDASCMCKVAC